ncbi:MAG: hypothetical protein H7211_08655 [Aquabacterium sp.]|nr:hypothetical protein [Ferruginibacter sp.]
MDNNYRTILATSKKLSQTTPSQSKNFFLSPKITGFYFSIERKKPPTIPATYSGFFGGGRRH